MTIQTLVLCTSPREGVMYAKRAGLKQWTYRSVYRAGQIKGIRKAEVHILPSFLESPGRHRVFSATRWMKGLEFFYVDPEDLPTLAEREAEKQADQLGELTDEQLDAAYAEMAEFDSASWHRGKLIADVQAMSDDEVAARIANSGPEQAVKVVEAVKAAPRPRRTPAKPLKSSVKPSVDDFFGA